MLQCCNILLTEKLPGGTRCCIKSRKITDAIILPPKKSIGILGESPSSQSLAFSPQHVNTLSNKCEEEGEVGGDFPVLSCPGWVGIGPALPSVSSSLHSSTPPQPLLLSPLSQSALHLRACHPHPTSEAGASHPLHLLFCRLHLLFTYLFPHHFFNGSRWHRGTKNKKAAKRSPNKPRISNSFRFGSGCVSCAPQARRC